MNKNGMLAIEYAFVATHISGYIPLTYGWMKGMESDSIQPKIMGGIGCIALNVIAALIFKYLLNEQQSYQEMEKQNQIKDDVSTRTIETLVQTPDEEQ